MNDIDEIKTRLDIVELIGERVTLKKAGRNFKGLCPFHTEKTPSFMVSPDRQSFHCFGCAKGGSVIDFVMEYEHIDFIEALEQLAGRAGIKLTKRIGDSPEQKRKEQIYEVNALASNFYQYMLLHHTLGEKALLYLKNRGISDKSIQTFGLGYSPNSWDALLKYLRKKGFEDNLIQLAGLSVSSTHQPINQSSHSYDRFRGRVMFPLRDHRGNVVGFSGRVLDPTIKEAKYINTSETPVYSKSNQLYGLDVTKASITKSEEAICMEGELDVISSFQEGVGNVVAIKGSALTEGHVHLLKRFAKTVIFCLDSDSAGDAASRRGIDIAENAGLEMKAVIIPSGKDPDEAVREDPVGFKKAVKDAVPIYDFFLLSTKKRYDLSSASGKKQASEEILPLFSRMTNAIVRGHYVKKFSRMLGVSEESIQDELRKVKAPLGRPSPEAEVEKGEALSRQEKIELYTLALLLQGNTKELWKEFADAIPYTDIAYPGIRRILEEVKSWFDTHVDFSIQEFVQTLPSELISLLDQAYLWDTSSVEQGGEEYLEEWKKTVRELHRTIIRAKLQELSSSTQVSEDPELQEKLSVLTKALSVLEKSNTF